MAENRIRVVMEAEIVIEHETFVSNCILFLDTLELPLYQKQNFIPEVDISIARRLVETINKTKSLPISQVGVIKIDTPDFMF